MSDFKIKSDVPMPKGRPTKYPFSNMSVGDSFEVPSVIAHKVRNAASSWLRTHRGVRFSVVKTGEHHTCWRIS